MAREMKNSGVEWIGNVPQEWHLMPLKSIIGKISSGSWGTDGKYPLDTICLRVADFDYDKGVFANTPVHKLTYRKYNKDINDMLLKKGDIVIEKSGGGEKTPVGRTVIFDKEYKACFSNFMCSLTIKKRLANSKYVEYYFKSLYGCNVTPYYINQTTGIQNLQLHDMLSNEKIFLPPLSEQQKIADFLDEKVKEIDNAIEKTKETIELYKKYKQSTITKVVTKGLDRDAPMKDSSIPWVGEIPDAWTVDILSKYISPVKNKNIGMLEKNLLSLSYGKIIKKDIKSNEGLLPASFEGYNIIEPSDIVLRLTDLQNDHKSLRVGYSQYRGIITSAYVTIRPNSYISPKYLYYVLHTFDIAKGFYGMGSGVRQGLNYDRVKTLKIPIPTLEEQQAIADYLDEYLEKIDSLTLKKWELIKELKSYKQSLIYEIVTGKKCVV